MPRRRARYRASAGVPAHRIRVPGLRRPVELAFVHRWDASTTEPDPAATRVVIGPEPPPEGLTPGPGVIFCHAEQGRAAVREAAAAYSAREAGAAPPPALHALMLAGATGPGGVHVALQIALGAGDTWPDALGRLIAAVAEAVGQRANRYADVLATALDFDAAPAPGILGRALAGLLRTVPEPPDEQPDLRAVLHRLQAVAAAADAEALVSACRDYRDPADLMDDVSLLRLATAMPHAAGEIAFMRAYLHRTAVPDDLPDLAIDRKLVAEQLSPEAVLAEPHRLQALRASFDLFRARYREAYTAWHERHQAALQRLREALESLRPEVEALQRLNTLVELGPPVGGPALEQHRALGQQVLPCPGLALPDDTPRCGRCAAPLGATSPQSRAEAAVEGVRAALAEQLRRLSQDAVRRILGRAERARVDRLLQAARASDLAGLARLLDDELAAFLRDLLREPAGAPDGVIARLMEAYPEVHDENLDAAVQAFRRLLQEALDAAQAASGARRVRLGPPEAG